MANRCKPRAAPGAKGACNNGELIPIFAKKPNDPSKKLLWRLTVCEDGVATFLYFFDKDMQKPAPEYSQADAVLSDELKGHSCDDPLKVLICGEDIELEAEDCEGEPVKISGKTGQLTTVVQAPGTALMVRLCEPIKEIEKDILCEKSTGHKIAILSDFTHSTIPVVTMWNLNQGAPWEGDLDTLETCADTDTESDQVEMCDNGKTFLRWVVKKDGAPTSVKFDTNLDTTPYIVTDEQSVRVGACSSCSVKVPLGVVTSWAL